MSLYIKQVPGKEGYFADPDGNIYSLWVNKGQHGLAMSKEFKQLNFSKSNSGHLVVSFGRYDKELVHRVIYKTFIGELEEGKVIRHLNDNPSDNRVSNLKQGTQKENVEDALKNKKFKTKLTEEDVVRIKVLKGYKKRKIVAQEFNVSEGTIKNVWNNKTWRYLNEFNN